MGTKFKICLPRSGELAGQPLACAAVIPHVPRGIETVLVLEDNEKMLQVTVQLLEQQGYRGIASESALRCFEILVEQAGPIAFLLTDVVGSGYTDDVIAQRGMLDHGVQFIQKPFTVQAPEDVLIGRSRGAPLQAIAAIYRRSAVVFLAMAGSHITRPQDFPGKSVASGGEGGAVKDFEFQLHALVRKLGLDLFKIRVVPYDSKYTAFIKGEADVTPAFSMAGLLFLRRQGLKLDLIWPSDYGIHFYSDALVTTDQTIREQSVLVTRFLRVSLKGWQDAVQDYEGAVAITLEYARLKDPQLQTAIMEGLLPLVHTGEDHVGWMRADAWQGMYDIVYGQKILSAPLEVNRAYTIRFLEDVYGGGTK
jgi:NitT/TauT family transport system substrate-binding protein